MTLLVALMSGGFGVSTVAAWLFVTAISKLLEGGPGAARIFMAGMGFLAVGGGLIYAALVMWP